MGNSKHRAPSAHLHRHRAASCMQAGLLRRPKHSKKKPLKGGEFNFFGSTFEIPDLKLPQGSKSTEAKSNGAGGHGIAERHRAPVI